jgi:N-acetylgalactosamine-N,N'-diacetylbacillosaminyl-diphospho-undecaprenol 4-alpha-N-acetylgalactosaminyltransferase
MKKVLMIIPNLDFGGAQNSFARASQMIHPYCQLRLVVFNRDHMAPLTFGAPLDSLEVRGSGNIIGKVTNFFRRVGRLRKIKQSFRPDISISFLEGADYVNLLSSVGEQILFYIHGSKMHDRNIAGWLGWVRKKIFIPFLYRRADRILVVNEALQKELITSFGLAKANYAVVPNFCDTQELATLAAQSLDPSCEKIFQEHRVIVIVGRLAREKGIDRFIPIFKDIAAQSDVRLVLVGDGPYRPVIEEACRQAGLSFARNFDEQASVYLVGFQKNPYAFMRRATLLALPSTNEGMPLTVMEALTLSLPVMASDCPYGPRELLSDTTAANTWPEFAHYGVLAPVPDHSSQNKEYWRMGVSRLLTDPQLRTQYAKRGPEKSKSFSREQVLSDWLKIVKD